MTTRNLAAPDDAQIRDDCPHTGTSAATPLEELARPTGTGSTPPDATENIESPAAEPRRSPVRSSKSIESVLASRWARILIPSLSDLFFLAILVWLFLSGGAAGWQGLLADADVGWHIRTGDYILAHHAVPHQDLYSFSKPGAPWYAWEWLSDVIDGGLHQIAGLKGVVLASAVIIALFATTLVRRMVWRGVHLLVALAVALLGVGAASIHFLARPHIYTLLFLSISMWLIEADREGAVEDAGASPGARIPEEQSASVMRGYIGRARIWWLVPLAVLWTNMHGGFLALIAVLGLTTVGLAVETFLETRAGRGDWRNVLRYAGLTGACAAATLINPYGWRLHQHVLEYLRSDWIRNVIQEFQSPSFRTENMMQFEALLLVGLMVAASLFRRRRIVEGLWIVFWAHMALGSARHVPVFVTVAVPVIAAELAQWWGALTARAGKASLAGIINQIASDSLPGFRRTSAWPFAAITVLIVMGAPIRWPRDFPDQVFPTKMVHDHADLITASRVLTTDQWGDYLIYTDPRRKVFVDGRSDFYGPEIGNEYLGLINGRWDWQQILAKYQFSLALVPTDCAIAQLLKLSPDWRVIEDDGKRIFLVRGPAPVPTQGNLHAEPRF
jgi:hypothetical protein